MRETSVTSKGQVTIPLEVRRRLGIRRGTLVEIRVVGDHAELRVAASPPIEVASGFGMLRSGRAPAPAGATSPRAHVRPVMQAHPPARRARAKAQSRIDRPRGAGRAGCAGFVDLWA